MTKSRILLALGLTLALAVPASAASMMDMNMDMGGWQEKWAAMADSAPYADKVHMAMMMADTSDRDFWLKCAFHKTDACDAALAEMMGK